MRMGGGLLVLGLTVMVLLAIWPAATQADVPDPDPDRFPIPTTPTPPPTPTVEPSPPPEPKDPSEDANQAKEDAKSGTNDQAESAQDALPHSSPHPAGEPPSAPPVDEPPEEPPVDPEPTAPAPEEIEKLTQVESPLDDSGFVPDSTDELGPLAALLTPPLPLDPCDPDASSVPARVFGSGRPQTVGDERASCGGRASSGSPSFFVPADVDWAAPRGASPLPFIAKAALVAVGLALLRFLGIGFTRLAHPEVLNHPHRSRILEFVQQNPGAGETTLARALGLRRATTRHHVDKLRQFGMLTVKEFRGRPSLFLPAHGNPRVQRGAAALRREPAQRAYHVLRESPGLDQAALGERLRLSQQRTSQILRSLKEAGLVLAERVGGRHRYRALELTGVPAPVASS